MVREGEGARRAERGEEEEEEEEDGGADPSLRPLPSRVLLANQRQHSEGSFSPAASFSLRASQQNPVRLLSGR